MTLFETIVERLRSMFRREPDADTWLLPGNEVTRAVEGGRNLAAYREKPPVPSAFAEPRATVEFDQYLEGLPPLPEPAKKIVISDDAVHAAAPVTTASSDKPLEATKPKKRWWRRAA